MLRLSPTEAAILARLYRARGESVGGKELDADLSPGPTSGCAKVHVHALRKKLGRDTISSSHWGYALTDKGVQRVQNLGQPVFDPAWINQRFLAVV